MQKENQFLGTYEFFNIIHLEKEPHENQNKVTSGSHRRRDSRQPKWRSQIVQICIT
jgi:hypothetical protein